MKVCQVGTGFTSIPPQGSAATEEVVYYLSRELIGLGCDVHVVDVSDKKRWPTNLRIHEVPYFSFIKTTKSNSIGLIARRLSFSFFSAIDLQRLKQGFDIVHFHNQFPAFTFNLFAKLGSKNIPVVYTLHNGMWGLPDSKMPKNAEIKFALEVRAMNSANKVIAVSETLRTNIIRRLRLKPSSIVVIPNGVDTNFFHPSRVSPALQKRLAPNGEKIVLCVGRISRYKGQKMLVDAMPRIIRENPQVKFVFVGPLDDTNYCNEISNTLNSQSLGKYCVFTGNMSPKLIPNYLAITDVFVLPSITEGLPLTLLQAMSSGRAVVASKIPQNMEVAKFGDEIVFVNPQNVEELSGSITQLLADENKRKELGQNARRTVLRYFDWKTIAKDTLQLYENIGRN
jgi:glycosyltransferase involved in cell wall biosynthesis